MANKSDDNIIVIEQDYLPSKQFEVGLHRPKFEDYRSARKRYPSPQANVKTPYSVEELLFSMMLHHIGPMMANQMPPKDVAGRLKPFSIPDRQFLLITFLEVFFVSNDEAQAARDYADRMMLKPSPSYTIPKEIMPSGELSITFVEPNTGKQMETDRLWTSPNVNGCSMEEMLLANSISTINGKTVETPKDVISLLDSWSIADVQFCCLVFVNMFTIDDPSSEAAKNLGKELRSKFSTRKGASSTKKATTRSASASGTTKTTELTSLTS